MRRISLKKKLGVIALVIAALAVLAGSYFRVLDNYELETLDMRFRLRGPIRTTDKVAIIEIGDDTIAKLGRFPIDRSYHAILTKALSSAGAESIVFDLFFSEPQDGDKEFLEAIDKAGDVYLPVVFELDLQRPRIVPYAAGYAARCLESYNKAAKGIGHINVIPDIDGKFRRAPAYIQYDRDRFQPYLSLLAACDYLGISQNDVKFSPGRCLDLGRGIKIPLDDNSDIIINYSAEWGRTYQHFSYVDIIQSYLAGITGGQPSMDLSRLKGKVCIVGLTAVGTVDLHPNPFDPLYPAVGMHAEVFSSIVNNDFIRRVPREVNAGILILFFALVAVVVFRTRPVKAILFLFAAAAILVLSGMALFDIYGIWIDLIYPLIGMVLLYISVTIYRYLAEWKKRLLIESELQIARKIQQSFLPKSMPSVEGLVVSAAMFTARQVGGDLYDFTAFSDSRLGIMIGDVSGKGVPASLFMAMSVGAFRTFALPEAAPEQVLASLNTKLTDESSSNLFVTIFYGIFDTKEKTFVFGNGGHLPVIYLKQGCEARLLDVEEGAPLGLMEGPYSGGRISYGSGDVLVFYTDGVTEAMNSRAEMYGKDRLLLAADRCRDLAPDKIVSEMEKDVRSFEPVSTQHDDITIIVVKAEQSI